MTTSILTTRFSPRLPLHSVCLVLLVLGLGFLTSCQGGKLKQTVGEMSGSSDMRQEVKFNTGVVTFTLEKNYVGVGGKKMIVNLRDANGSIMRELFKTSEQGTFTNRAEINKPGKHTVQVEGAAGDFKVSWE